MEYPKFKVCVRCFTFNHSKYITDAMNGFVMQQTDFPYVCCIVDDASTDGEQEVIRKYVSDNFDLSEGSCHFERETDYAFITYAQHKSNKNCYFTVLYLKENHYSIKKSKMPYLAEWQDGCEYEALCEGDDYWIHPGKLQMQVDFLDENKDYSMCFHNAKVVGDGVQFDSNMYDFLEDRDYTGEEILLKWTVPTASVVCRKIALSLVPRDNRFIHGDIVIFLTMASSGRIRCINKFLSVYRRNANGVSFSGSKHIDIKKVMGHFDAILEHFGNQYYHIIVERKSYWCVCAFISGRLGPNSRKSVVYSLLDKNVFYLFIKKIPKSLYSAVRLKIKMRVIGRK